MCGILAYITDKEINHIKISKIRDLMTCRGPDNQTYKKKSFGKKNYIYFIRDYPFKI